MNRTNQLKALAQQVAFAARAQNREAISEAQKACTESVLDLDLGLIDRDSSEYRVGGVESLASMLTSLESQTLSDKTIRILHKCGRARLINAVIARKGLNQKQLAAFLGLQSSNLNTYLKELLNDRLIEPAPAEGGRGRSYRITPWGMMAWLRIVDGTLGVRLPETELASAVSVAGVKKLSRNHLIGKAEFYDRLRAALKKPSDSEVLLSSLQAPKMKARSGSAQFYRDALKLAPSLRRPLHWLFVDSRESREFVQNIRERAGDRARYVYAYYISQVSASLSTRQVVDDVGLVYPAAPDKAEESDRETSIEVWNELRSTAKAV